LDYNLKNTVAITDSLNTRCWRINNWNFCLPEL